jgi:hypothetical protein
MRAARARARGRGAGGRRVATAAPSEAAATVPPFVCAGPPRAVTLCEPHELVAFSDDPCRV